MIQNINDFIEGERLYARGTTKYRYKTISRADPEVIDAGFHETRTDAIEWCHEHGEGQVLNSWDEPVYVLLPSGRELYLSGQGKTRRPSWTPLQGDAGAPPDARSSYQSVGGI